MNAKHLAAVALIALVWGSMATAAPQPISVLISDIETNIAGGQAMPNNLFNTSGPFPFSNITVGGRNTEALVYAQVFEVQRGQEVLVQGIPGGTLPDSLDVTEFNSQFLFDERPEQVFTLPGQTEPLDNSRLVMGGGLPSTMTLTLLDADPNDADPFTPFFNDLLPEVTPGTSIGVYTGEPVQVEIVALELVSSQPITVATNTMVPFQFFADDGNNVLDNAFGVFESEWLVPNTSVELDGISTDGTSPFLENWPDPRQYRWKPHPGGWTRVVVGTSTGPAALLHLPPPQVPEPSSFALILLGLLSIGFIGWRRRRR